MVEPVAALHTDAAPSVGDHTKIIFLAGAIKHWWEDCPWCYGRGNRLPDRVRDNIPGMMVSGQCTCRDCDGTGKVWDSPLHKEYVAWRDEVRAVLIDHGYLTYAPHEAFKGTWTERAQAINDAGIQMADLMLVLSPPHIPTFGTDDEVLIAERYGTPVLPAPPSLGIRGLLSLLEILLVDKALT